MFDETNYILSYVSADNAIVKFTTDARNVRLLPIETLKDAYATHQLHCQWRSDSCRAKRPANASSVRQCCAAATDGLAAGRHSTSCNWPGWGRCYSAAI